MKAMNSDLKEVFYGHTTAMYTFRQFRVRLVVYSLAPSSEVYGSRGSVQVSCIVQGGTSASRHVPSICEQGAFQQDQAIFFPAIKIVVDLDEGSYNVLNRTSAEIGFLLRKVYCELALNPTFDFGTIEKTMVSFFLYQGVPDPPDWFDSLLDTLHRRWDKFPSLENLAHELKIHPVTISKYFSKKLGITFSEYMRKIKVERAVDRLLNTADSFASVAFSCGFSDQSHMNRWVKSYINYTPGAIRSLLMRKERFH